MIVEFAKQQRENDLSIYEAAANLHFRAILMTSFSFIVSVMLLIIASGLDAASLFSLGTAVFDGMLIGTIVGLFLIPTLIFSILNNGGKGLWKIIEYLKNGDNTTY